MGSEMCIRDRNGNSGGGGAGGIIGYNDLPLLINGQPIAFNGANGDTGTPSGSGQGGAGFFTSDYGKGGNGSGGAGNNGVVRITYNFA